MIVLYVLALAIGWAVAVVIGLRALTGEWPDRRAPGSHTAGSDESAWLAEQPTRAERSGVARAAVRQRIAELLWFEGAAEITLAVRAGRRGPLSLPDFF